MCLRRRPVPGRRCEAGSCCWVPRASRCCCLGSRVPRNLEAGSCSLPSASPRASPLRPRHRPPIGATPDRRRLRRRLQRDSRIRRRRRRRPRKRPSRQSRPRRPSRPKLLNRALRRNRVTGAAHPPQNPAMATATGPARARALPRCRLAATESSHFRLRAARALIQGANHGAEPSQGEEPTCNDEC